jgi:hypothetical protein
LPARGGDGGRCREETVAGAGRRRRPVWGGDNNKWGGRGHAHADVEGGMMRSSDAPPPHRGGAVRRRKGRRLLTPEMGRWGG